MAPRVYVIAGPNGVGKTTFAKEFLPKYAKCPTFIDADVVAQGLAPFKPGMGAIRAGKLLVEQIRKFAEREETFAFETTLAGKRYGDVLKKMKAKGYRIHIFFLWIPTVKMALARIVNRVKMGGHSIPSGTVDRRFRRGLHNFLVGYQNLADSWYLFDNSNIPPVLVARSEEGKRTVLNKQLYEEITQANGGKNG